MSSCRPRPSLILWLAFALGASACGHGFTDLRSIDTLERDPGWIVVPGVPLVRQTAENDCGAAALAMVLTFWGRPTAIADVTALHPPKPNGGILAGALRDVARSQGVFAFLVRGTVDDLARELGRGRPVIVGLVKKRGRKAYAHYAVVVGLERNRGHILVIDPAHGWRRGHLDAFTVDWTAGERVTLVLLSPSSS